MLYSFTNSLGGIAINETVVRYKVLGSKPHIIDSVKVAEMLRTATLSVFGRILGYDNIPELVSGKTVGSSDKIQGYHQHAHFFCEPDFETGEITHISIFTPTQIPFEHLLIFAQITEIWNADFGRIFLEPTNEDPFLSSVIYGSSAKWKSLTPFLLDRHLRIKRSEKHDEFTYNQALERELIKQIEKELADRNLPEPLSVTFDRKNGVDLNQYLSISWNEFRRFRTQSTRRPAIEYGHGFEITFNKKTTGPLALGYASHFSLGLFTPVNY